MKFQKITAIISTPLIIALSSLLLVSSAFAINFTNGVDLSFFDEKNPVKQTNEAHSPRTDFKLAVQAYNNGNYIKAYTLFNTLAIYGNTSAQYSLGSMYYNGNGVLQNRQQAALWYRQSARSGHVIAQHNLGALYYHGHGVMRSYSHALKWFTMAAQQGHAEAQYNLAVMHFSGKGVAQNRAAAFKWFSRAAAQGNINSQHNLGAMYSKGLGVEQNMILAYQWHTRAARNGHDLSKQWLRIQMKHLISSTH